MTTRFKPRIALPYSLHDMVVGRITCQNDAVRLEFCHGYVSMKEPYPQVEGHITIENVDMEDSYVLLSSRFGQYGDFTGAKIALADFVGRHHGYFFEIIDEMYGFQQVEYIGYLSSPAEDHVQMSLSIYFTGDIVYETEER